MMASRHSLTIAIIAAMTIACWPLADAEASSKTYSVRGLWSIAAAKRAVIESQVESDKFQGPVSVAYETKWFTQLVDHFGWANQDTWLQRYLVNKDAWCGDRCPILFYTGNEGDIEGFTNNTGWMWENARRLGAMLVFAEHRYYGQSFPYQLDPTKRTPDELDKLGYQSSEQALADFARLIYELKNSLYAAKHSPVITVGGSYGGMLAAWMRMKYPHLVTGALAASAPILQFEGEYDCERFSVIATKTFEGYGANCSRSIRKSWSSLSSLSSSQDGLAKIGEIFNTCAPVTAKSAKSLSDLLSEIWVNMAMTDYANEASFLSKMPAYPIKHACAHLSQEPSSVSDEQLLRAISRAMQVYTNYTGASRCLDLETSLNDPMDVGWDFQSCTEMVMPICSDGVNDMFLPQEFDLTTIVRDCKAKWNVTTQVDKVRTMYGDRRSYLQSASNIIFSSCERDPWSAGCPQESNESREIHAIKIPGAVHHEDLRPAGPNDSEALKTVRKVEVGIVERWISKHDEDNKREFDLKFAGNLIYIPRA